MRLLKVTLNKNQPNDEDSIEVEGLNGTYIITGEQLERLLIEDEQLCEFCEDEGCDNCKDYDSQREGK